MSDRQHSPVRNHAKIFLAGRTGTILWDDGSKGRYLVLFASDFYLRVKDTTDGTEFVTVRESLFRFYPEEPA